MDHVNARICARRDTTANWAEQIGFVPLLGEICIYTDHGTVLDGDDNPVNVPGIKIGDGVSLLSDLPFVSDDEQAQILTELRTHTANQNVHVTDLDKTAWNAKADKAQSFTTGNFAVLDETGGIADSGHKHSDYLTEHQDISGKMDLSLKGAANGVAELGSDGKVPSGQLPSYVDDVLEYASLNEFPVTGESGKIYIALDTNKTYRWSGSIYAEISKSLALGETSATAYRGDRGAAAYAAAVTNVETTPTEDSTNLITSGAVYAGLDEKADRTDIPEVPVTDVQVNGTSILNQGVANVPIAGANAGTVKVPTNNSYGLQMYSDGNIAIAMGSATDIKNGSGYYKPIVPTSQHQATFYGLAKAAGDNTQSASSNPVGTYTNDAKAAIKTMLGVTDPTVSDVQIDGISILDNGVANVPVATSNSYGVMKIGNGLVHSSVTGKVTISPAWEQLIKAGVEGYNPLVPSKQHKSVYYGLAKLAGADMASLSGETVGVYPEAQKTAIQAMLDVPSQEAIANKETATATSAHAIGELFLMGGKLYKAKAAIAIGDTIVTSGVSANAEQTNIAEEIPAVPVQDVQIDGTSILNNGVANVPIAGPYVKGVVKVSSTYGLDVGTTNQHIGFLRINPATLNLIKNGGGYYNPLTVDHQHEAAFYGFAKAAGDTTQKNSANSVGSYTPEAKAAIWQMLGLDGSAFVQSDWELIREDTVTNATEADIEITADGNGNAFSITDAILVVFVPKEGTQVVIGSYGQVHFNVGSSTKITAYLTANTFDGNTKKEAVAQVTQDNGMLSCKYIPYGSVNANAQWCSHLSTGESDSTGSAFRLQSEVFDKIIIKAITGKIKYKLFGKRKRNGLDSPVINVSGTTPTITALPGHRYVCGEVSTLTIVVPASGIIDVTFESGSTPTVLTVTPPTGMTMRWIGDDPTALEANKHYEINIMDGCNGMVVSWT